MQFGTCLEFWLPVTLFLLTGGLVVLFLPARPLPKRCYNKTQQTGGVESLFALLRSDRKAALAHLRRLMPVMRDETPSVRLAALQRAAGLPLLFALWLLCCRATLKSDATKMLWRCGCGAPQTAAAKLLA